MTRTAPDRRVAAVAVALLAVTPLFAGGLAVVSTELRDNGDDDGYADTNETVELWLTVRNTTAATLSGVGVEAIFAGGRAICVLDASSAFGTIAPEATVRALDPIVFHVAPDRDRGALGLSPYDTLAVALELRATATGPAPAALPAKVVFDLDLDVTPGGTPTAFTEDFESGFGAFAIQNLDLGRHDDADPEFGAADGWRCQYNEPFCTHATCEGDPGWDACSPGMDAAAADATWWSVDATRGRSGSHALYYGVPLGGDEFTTPQGVLEAARTSPPIHLDADPGIEASLTFAHQLSLVDWRTTGDTPWTTGDRAVVGVQLADGSGAPVGPWIKVDPSVNGYDQQAAIYSNCTFDPLDDGSTGDDLFPPWNVWDGLLRRGPSSTCLPEKVFAWIGDTDDPFSPTAVGGADGPGLPGSIGPGAWIESRFDLSRFRGRSVRVRFLVSSIRIGGPYPTWESAFQYNPDPRDDGWWIDDVEVTGARDSAGAVLADASDNSALPEPPDGDGDLWFDACDGCPAIADPAQDDADGDRIGDLCDTCTDTDADGFGDPGFAASTCPLDNCPLVPNPTQLDSDGDLFGDACDGCPFVNDPTQADADLDGTGDACDCAPADSATYPGAPEINDGVDNNCPGDADFGIVDEISGAIRFGPDGDHDVLFWPAQAGASSYGIYWELRDASVTPAAPPAWCAGATTFNPAYDTSATVPPAQWIAYYLVRPATPHAGSLGRSSAGIERVGVLCGD